jgi:VIT1/CCC1 family predicted Fe2+/Mn2+ transporter
VTAWDEYVAAAQRLDTVRRHAAAVVAEQAALRQTAREELNGVRTRLQLQQGRLRDAARQAGAAPTLEPTEVELDAARVGLGPADTPETIRAALAGARMSLDSADAVLSGVSGAVASPSSGVLRNVLVYGGYALLAAFLQILVFFATSEEDSTAILVLGCGVLSPLLVFGLGWLTVGALAPPRGAARPGRTPVIGATLSVLSLTPIVTMVVWLAIQAIGR